jgi:hypothetical protein
MAHEAIFLYNLDFMSPEKTVEWSVKQQILQWILTQESAKLAFTMRDREPKNESACLMYLIGKEEEPVAIRQPNTSNGMEFTIYCSPSTARQIKKGIGVNLLKPKK